MTLKINSSLNQIVFGAFLFLGMMTGFALTSQPRARIGASADDTSSISVATTNQRNVLIVAVEQMDSSLTRIEGIWLVMHMHTSHNYSLVPIYPATSPTMRVDYLLPHEPLWLNPQKLENVDQLTILKAQGIWWNDVVMVDRVGVREMLILSGLVDLPLAVAWEVPREAQNDQAGILKQLCGQHVALGEAGKLAQLLSLTPEHLRSSMNHFKLIEVWEELTSKETIFNCEFPSLGDS